MSARRIAYAWFICLPLFLAYCVSTLRFLSSLFSNPFYAVPLSIGPKNNPLKTSPKHLEPKKLVLDWTVFKSMGF